MATLSDKLQKRVAQIRREDSLFVRHSLEIAYFVQSELERQGRTQKELAAAIGKKESEVSKWLSGIHNLTLQSLSLLEAGLGVNIITIGRTQSELIAQDESMIKLCGSAPQKSPRNKPSLNPSKRTSGALKVSEPVVELRVKK